MTERGYIVFRLGKEEELEAYFIFSGISSQVGKSIIFYTFKANLDWMNLCGCETFFIIDYFFFYVRPKMPFHDFSLLYSF